MSYRAEGSVRRSQLLFRAGPGALVDLVDHAVVISGLDDWGYPPGGPDGFDIQEPRLVAKALKMLAGSEHWRHPSLRLRSPPRCDDDKPNPAVGVTAREFPGWFMCQYGPCGSLVQRRALDKRHRHTCTHGGSSYPAVPVRFVLACARGHLVDVNWRSFVHRGQREEGMEGPLFCHEVPGEHLDRDPLKGDATADLFLRSYGTTGDLTDTVVGCRRCGKSRGLQDLTQPHNHGRCSGWRPWLPQGANEICEEQPKLLTRTASNAYFPQSISALSIPSGDAALTELVRKHWGHLQNQDCLEDLAFLRRKMPWFSTDFEMCSDQDVLDVIQRMNTATSQRSLREVEWESLRGAEWASLGELPKRDEVFFARAEDKPLPPFLDRLVLVHKLREVRAQIGFTRIDSIQQDAEGEFSLAGQQSAPLSLTQDWIPAIEARGEGIFLAFNEQWLRDWEAREAVQARMKRFSLASLEGHPAGPDRVALHARLVLLHTISHMLITQISLEAGYPAASIRERLYCARHTTDLSQSRGGILLSTGTTGSGGTLGGLVQVGRDIERHLREACERALLCSNDPVCSQHDPGLRVEGRERHGAACHACLLIAEPSCERMNQDLDRTLVVPTVHEAEAAALGNWLGL